ncbi:hypothetical protein D3C87_2042720 [compost metagenome]
MDVRRDTATVVGHGDGAIGIERDGDDIGMAGQGLIDRVVDDFVDHVMKTGAVIRITDIHAGALANGI